jgi:deazaflavin-dependent oxidoreductase (nitroreductase family)
MTPSRSPQSLFERAVKAFGRTAAGRWYVRNISVLVDPALLRLTGGRVSSVYPVSVMLLTTIGARTGLQRTLPLVYLNDGAGLILVASNFGNKTNPAWYRNLLANPKVEVLAGKDSGSYLATEISDPTERDRTWALVLDMNTGYDYYEARAGDRTIPLISLMRVGRSGPRAARAAEAPCRHA